jgi:hypothetical protein
MCLPAFAHLSDLSLLCLAVSACRACLANLRVAGPFSLQIKGQRVTSRQTGDNGAVVSAVTDTYFDLQTCLS